MLARNRHHGPNAHITGATGDLGQTRPPLQREPQVTLEKPHTDSPPLLPVEHLVRWNERRAQDHLVKRWWEVRLERSTFNASCRNASSEGGDDREDGKGAPRWRMTLLVRPRKTSRQRWPRAIEWTQMRSRSHLVGPLAILTRGRVCPVAALLRRAKTWPKRRSAAETDGLAASCYARRPARRKRVHKIALRRLPVGVNTDTILVVITQCALLPAVRFVGALGMPRMLLGASLERMDAVHASPD